MQRAVVFPFRLDWSLSFSLLLGVLRLDALFTSYSECVALLYDTKRDYYIGFILYSLGIKNNITLNSLIIHTALCFSVHYHPFKNTLGVYQFSRIVVKIYLFGWRYKSTKILMKCHYYTPHGRKGKGRLGKRTRPRIKE